MVLTSLSHPHVLCVYYFSNRWAFGGTKLKANDRTFFRIRIIFLWSVQPQMLSELNSLL